MRNSSWFYFRALWPFFSPGSQKNPLTFCLKQRFYPSVSQLVISYQNVFPTFFTWDQGWSNLAYCLFWSRGLLNYVNLSLHNTYVPDKTVLRSGKRMAVYLFWNKNSVILKAIIHIYCCGISWLFLTILLPE